jgi:hypothetical protein
MDGKLAAGLFWGRSNAERDETTRWRGEGEKI